MRNPSYVHRYSFSRDSQIVILQKNFKMLVARRRYAPRIKGVSRLKQLVSQIQAMRQIANSLSGNEQKTYVDSAAISYCKFVLVFMIGCSNV